ncbi:MAG: LptF/LptG family permease [Candidatus Lightella neohaematopini]|nr:LptF/LptG family permease [Candidatus Lightella neohaematopini]
MINKINKYTKLLFGILNLYILKNIFIYTIQISCIISVLSCINKLIEISNKTYNYSTTHIVLIILFNIIKDIELFLPIIISLSVLCSIISLITKNELIIILTLKKNFYQIIILLIKISIITSIFFLLILEITLSFNYLLFNFDTKKNTNNFSIYIKNSKKFILIDNIYNNKIFNINIFYITNNNKLYDIYHARIAKFIKNYWILYDVNHLKLTKSISNNYIPICIWHTNLTPYELHIFATTPELLSIKQLYYQINFLKKNNMEYYYYQLYMWNKLLLPINITIIIFFTTSISFRKLNIFSIKNIIINSLIINFLFYIIHQFILYISFIIHGILSIIIISHLILLIYCIKINKVCYN